MVGKGWVQAVALVVIFGFFVMGILAYRTYTASMPQPERVVTADGAELFTGADITAGQEIFLLEDSEKRIASRPRRQKLLLQSRVDHIRPVSRPPSMFFSV